jgi:fructoselysine-6-P-deglycase FrlB-like protein
MGSPLPGCLPLEACLNKRGIAAVAIDASELLPYRLPVCGPGAVVLVSRSGEAVELVKRLPKLNVSGTKVIGGTNETGARSTVSRTAPLWSKAPAISL